MHDLPITRRYPKALSPTGAPAHITHITSLENTRKSFPSDEDSPFSQNPDNGVNA